MGVDQEALRLNRIDILCYRIYYANTLNANANWCWVAKKKMTHAPAFAYAPRAQPPSTLSQTRCIWLELRSLSWLTGIILRDCINKQFWEVVLWPTLFSIKCDYGHSHWWCWWLLAHLSSEMMTKCFHLLHTVGHYHIGHIIAQGNAKCLKY